MPRAPWLSGAVSNKLATDARRERLQVRGLEGLPVNQERARVEQAEGERSLRSSRPPNSRRWRQLAKHDDAIDKAAQRHADALQALQQAEQQLQAAPTEDARTLADWLARGERGERPASSLYERERERDAARLLVDAATLELDSALEQRHQHIDKHRPRMLEDAQQDARQASERLLAHARQLPELRAQLLEARRTLEWAATYPEHAPTFGFPTSLALGLRQPVQEAFGTSARIEYDALLNVLEADATALATRYSPEIERKLGAAPPATPASEAMWSSDPRAQEWGKLELERARRLGEWQDPNQLAADVRDLRPDP